jgi:hypothetical protein
MTRRDEYRAHLQALDRDQWQTCLVAESALPGPRANLELAEAAADLAEEAQLLEWLNLGPDAAPESSASVFLPVCGAIGLGRLVAEGRIDLLPRLRSAAGDGRWRVREAVVLGLQRLGDRDINALVNAMRDWSQGTFLEKRAAAAALCEPRLLRDPAVSASVLKLLNDVTESVQGAPDRRDGDLRVLRQALGYCWSVLIVALPTEGKAALESWSASSDPDIRWIIRENLRKARLRRMDDAWVERLAGRF